MMLRQFLVCAAVTIGTIAIHAFLMTLVLVVARMASERATAHPALRLTVVMAATVLVLMSAHVAEVALWALTYATVDVAPPDADLVYFAFVNFATLGYGDIVPLPRWRLLGPMTAMNGALMFGWSTAVMFEVLRRTMMTDRVWRIAPD